MEKSIKNLISKLAHIADGKLEGGFGHIKGGFAALEYVTTNGMGSTCSNGIPDNCSSSANFDCSNTALCQGAVNSHSCSNSASCVI